MRIVTWNLHSGVGTDGVRSVARIAEELRALRPDVVCLQEVCRRFPPAALEDQPRRIARALGMRALFGPTLGGAAMGYGNAVLTGLPMVSSSLHFLPNARERASGRVKGEKRGAVVADLEAVGRSLRVICTHWGLDAGDRLEAAADLARLARETGGPCVMAGDLNARPGDAEVARLLAEAGLRDAGAETDLPTFPAQGPHSRIDFVLHTPDLIAEELPVPVSIASDHLPVVCDLRLR
jgi:endonuclease/exonuclease/phosphatase family metal-dependent hydrolase